MFRNYRMQIWTICALVLVTLFFLIGLYQNGLFFAPVQTYFMTAMVVVGLVTTVGLRGWNVRMPVWVILAFAYATYTLLTTMWAANAGLAVQGSVVIPASVLLALLGRILPAWCKRYLLTLIALSGTAMYLLALGALFHWWNYTAAVIPDQSGNMQMTSIFQYHNTFGAFELVAFVICLGLMDLTRTWWERGLYLLCAAFSVLGVLSSYSREVWILLPVTLIMLVLVQFIRKRIGRTLLHVAYALLVGAAAAPTAITALSHSSMNMGVLTLAIVVAASTIIGLLDHVMPHLLRTRAARASVLVVMGMVALVAVIVLAQHEAHKLGSITSRLGSIQLKDFSVQQRIVFYQAALHMWQTTPIFGSGMGTWTSKFLAFQQYPYQTTQSHSVVLNNLIDGGIIGILLWLGVLVTAISSAVKSIRNSTSSSAVSSIAVVAALTMLIHGAFDFDFTFAMVTAVFFLLLGIGAEGQVSVDNVNAQSLDRTSHLGTQTSGAGVRPKAIYSVIANMVMGITACVAMVVGTMLSVGQHLFHKATVTDKYSTPLAEVDLQGASKWAPFLAEAHTQLAQDYYTDYTQNHSQATAVQAFQQAQLATSGDPWNPATQQSMAIIAYRLGAMTQAYAWSQRGAIDSPFHIEYPTSYMGIGLWTAVQQYKQNPQLNTEKLQMVVNQLHYAENNINIQNHMTFGYHPDWTYNISATMQSYAGAADLALGNYENSLKDMSGLMQRGPDANTVGLYDLVTLLDEQHLHPGYKDPQLEQTVMSNPTFKAEYQDLVQIRPIP